MASALMRKINILIVVTLVALAMYSFLNFRRSISSKDKACPYEPKSKNDMKNDLKNDDETTQNVVKELEGIAKKDPIDVAALTSQIVRLRETLNARVVQQVDVQIDMSDMEDLVEFEEDAYDEDDDDDDIIDDDALEVVSISSNEIKSIIAGSVSEAQYRPVEIKNKVEVAEIAEIPEVLEVAEIPKVIEVAEITPKVIEVPPEVAPEIPIVAEISEKVPTVINQIQDDIELIPKTRKIDYKQFKVDELKEHAKAHGIEIPKSHTTKAQLIALLSSSV